MTNRATVLLRQGSRAALPFVLLSAVVAGCRPAASSSAPPDSPTARQMAARRYLEQVPLDDMLSVLMNNVAGDRQGADRENYRVWLSREIRRDRIEEAIALGLEKTFTAEEIAALTAFHSSPEGRSIQRKTPAYLQEFLPLLQEELDRVLSLTNAARASIKWPVRLKTREAGLSDEYWEDEFPFVNEGLMPVTLKDVHAACGCTTVKLEKNTYLPGERGRVPFRFDFGNRTGL